MPCPDADPIQYSVNYAYNQRNLLVSQSQYNESEGAQQVAGFVYDGANNRIQQVDYTGAQPATTTYTNDVLGLAQVLLASDGSMTTTNLFGLDLIYTDNGTTPRTMLADGLGSVRVEMVENTVDTITTYEPFGKLLAQTGTSGTTYGYTGEAHDAATGLVYLRARYYDPNTNHFLTRDPYRGLATMPASQNGYSYVHGNPINYADPSGLCIEGYPSGGVRPNQYPYGTSGICPYTLGRAGWLVEAPHEVDNYVADLAITPINLKPDAVGVYFSIHGGGTGFEGQTGYEVIYNSIVVI